MSTTRNFVVVGVLGVVIVVFQLGHDIEFYSKLWYYECAGDSHSPVGSNKMLFYNGRSI